MSEQRFTFYPHNVIKALKCLKGARSTDESRPILTQYHFSLTGHNMIIEATDSFRLYVADLQLSDYTQALVNDMAAITDKLDFDFCVEGEWIDRWTSQKVSLSDVVTWVVTPAVNGTYVPPVPGLNQIGRMEGVQIGSIEIINHIEQTSMKLALHPRGNFPNTKVLIPTTTDQDLPIRVRAKYLAHIFKSANDFNSGGWIDIQSLDQLKPCVFRAVSDRDVLTMLIMPLRAGPENTLNGVQPRDIGTS